MKTAIVYYSKHHGNTKKLLDAIVAKNDVLLIDALKPVTTDLSAFDAIGFASGVYYSKFHKSVAQYAKENLPTGKPVFFIYTYGAEKKGYADDMRKIIAEKNCKELGAYGCFGFNTFGPFKLIGGIAKGHPTADETNAAITFYNGICK